MVKATNKEIKVKTISEKMILPTILRSKIDAFWALQKQNNPHLFNGEVWNVITMEEKEDCIELIIQKTDYAHYLYDERHGITSQYACYILSSGVLVETKDQFLVLGQLAQTTSYQGCLQVSGGGIEEKDSVNGELNMVKTAQRELQEELNLNLQDSSQIQDYQFAYLEIPEGNRHAYSVILKAKTTLTASQLQKYFEAYKKHLEQTGGELEFEKLFFLPKGKTVAYLDGLENPKRLYVRQMLEIEDRQAKRQRE